MQPDDESNRDPSTPKPDDHTLADDASRERSGRGEVPNVSEFGKLLRSNVPDDPANRSRSEDSDDRPPRGAERGSTDRPSIERSVIRPGTADDSVEDLQALLLERAPNADAPLEIAQLSDESPGASNVGPVPEQTAPQPSDAGLATADDVSADTSAAPAPAAPDDDATSPPDNGAALRAVEAFEFPAELSPNDTRAALSPPRNVPEPFLPGGRDQRHPLLSIDPETGRLLPPTDDTPDAERPTIELREEARSMLNPTSDGGPPLARPIVLVRIPDEQTSLIIDSVLDAAAKRDYAMVRAIADERILFELGRRDSELRAILGAY